MVGEEGLADGLDGDASFGSPDAVCDGCGGGRGVVRCGVPAFRGQPEDGLQVARALADVGRCQAIRPVSGAAEPSAGAQPQAENETLSEASQHLELMSLDD